jgi:hypothetical protein
MKFEEEFTDLAQSPDTGAVSCFCSDATNEVAYGDKFEFFDRDGTKRSEPICNQFLDDTSRAKTLSTLCAILIAVINQVITSGIVKIMENVGMTTHSRKSSLIAFCVFFLQFLNTGVLLLLVTANFKEQGIDPYNWF